MKIPQKHLDKFARRAGQLRNKHNLSPREAGYAVCWLAGIQPQYISSLADVMDKRRRLARRGKT